MKNKTMGLHQFKIKIEKPVKEIEEWEQQIDGNNVEERG